MKTDKIIMYNSDEAAKQVTVTGWMGSDGRFWGKDEHMARWGGCTHLVCGCGNVMEKAYTKCKECRLKLATERYNALPFKEWDGNEPVCLPDGDKYFFSVDDLEEFMEEEELNEVSLLFCVENVYSVVESDYWNDVFPEDSDGDLPKEMQDALDKLNAVIKKEKPASYSPGKVRTYYTKALPSN